MFLRKDIEGVHHELVNNIYFASMTEYEHGLGAHPIYSIIDLNNSQTNPLSHPLGQVVSDAGLTQLHIGETEKVCAYHIFLMRDEKNRSTKNCALLSHRKK